MTIFDKLDAHLQNPQDEATADALVESLKGFFKAASSGQRLKAESEWYTNELYREGLHWVQIDRAAGTLQIQKSKGRVQRPINLVRKELRGIKNFIQSQQVNWMVSPADDNDEAKSEAVINNQLLQGYLYDKLDISSKLYDVFDNGFMKYFGTWQLEWDDDVDDLCLYTLDTFDVYPDPSVREPRDGDFMIKTSKVTLARIKRNDDYYPARQEVTADNKESASDFKESLGILKNDKGQASNLDETSTAIVYDVYLKRPAEEEVPESVDEQGQLVPGTPAREQEIWLCSYAAGKLLRAEKTPLKRFNIMFLCPERTNHRLYGATWVKDLIPVNRTFENVFSLIEDYILKIKPKLMKPKGSTLSPISDETGEILEYSGAIADQLKEFMPAGLPATHFNLLNLASRLLEDIGGVHQATMGSKQSGLDSGVAIHAMQAADDTNVDQPKTFLERFLEETGELALELIASHQVTETDKSFMSPQGGFFKQKIMGQGGLMDASGQPTPDAPAPLGTHVVKPSRVRVNIPRTHYDNYLKMIQSAKQGQPPPDTAPKPPPPPADKVMQALAAEAKSGIPVAPNQVEAANEAAGLPPAPPPQPMASSAPVPPIPT